MNRLTLDKYRGKFKNTWLMEEEKTIVIELLARGYSNTHAAEELAELTGTKVNRANIQYYRSSRREQIAEIRETLLKDRDTIEAHFADPWARIVALSRTAEELLRTKQYPEFRRYMHEISVQLGEQSPQIVIQNMYESIQRRGGHGIEVVMVNLKEAVGDDKFVEMQTAMDQKYLEELDQEQKPGEED